MSHDETAGPEGMRPKGFRPKNAHEDQNPGGNPTGDDTEGQSFGTNVPEGDGMRPKGFRPKNAQEDQTPGENPTGDDTEGHHWPK